MPAAILPLAGLLLGAALLLAGNGLQGLLLPVRAIAEGFTTLTIGLIAAAYSLGFVISCRWSPRVIGSVGHIRSFAAFAAIGASVVLLMMLAVHPWVWIPLRVVSGFCLAGLFMVIESWLNDRADNTNRGKVFSAYMVINLGAITLGQLILPLGDPTGPTLFAITAIAITLALVPVSLTRSAAPQPIREARLRWRRLYELSPVGVTGCFFIGLVNGAFGGLGALFAQRSGLSTTGTAMFMAAALLGGALAQIPLGRLSDRIDRRRVIVGLCVLSMGLGVALALLGNARASGTLLGWMIPFDAPPAVFLVAVVGLFGASMYPLYSLCVSHTNDFVAREEFVDASSGLLLTWGIGATIGPLLAPPVMDHIGLGGLFMYTATIHACFAAFTLYRMIRRAPIAAQERVPFVAAGQPARISPAAMALDPRTERAAEV